MPNMSLTKVPMPEQDPNVRNKLLWVILKKWLWKKQLVVLTVRTNLV